MALWRRIKHLPQIRQEYLYSLYNDQFPLIIRSTVPEIIEAQQWSEIDVNNAQHREYSDSLFLSLIRELRRKGNEDRNMDLLSSTENVFNMYCNRSNEFVALVKSNLQKEMKEIISEMANFGQGKSVPVNEISENLETLRLCVQQCQTEARRMQYQQEQYINQKHEALRRRSYLQQMTLNGQQMTPRITKIMTETQTLETAVRMNGPVLMDDIKKTTQNIHDAIAALKAIQKFILNEELNKWISHQGLSELGFQVPNNLREIQIWCECIAEMLWKLKQQLESLNVTCSRLRCLLDLNPFNDQILALKSGVVQQLINLVSKTFIVEKQPPQVIKTNTQFEATVRLLVGKVLNVDMIQPTVSVSIINEPQRRICAQNGQLKKTDTSGQILNNKANMNSEMFRDIQCITAAFKNMKLTKPKRADKKAMESVVDEKFSLHFQSEFTIGGEITVNLSCCSLPIVVVVHCNQEPKAWATIIWDNAFSQRNRLPFEVPESVSWKKLAEVLNVRFKKMIGKELTREHLNYLASKAFGTNGIHDDQQISWTMFVKEQVYCANYVFWDWVYATFKLSQKLEYLWHENFIFGYISKAEACEILRNAPIGTFLLRFSDSALGSIVVAFVGHHRVEMVEPWNLKGFEVLSLADRILDLGELLYLYPDIPKEFAFGKYRTANKRAAPAAEQESPYLKAFLRISLNPHETKVSLRPSNVCSPSPSQTSDFDFALNFDETDIDLMELEEALKSPKTSFANESDFLNDFHDLQSFCN